MRKIFFKFLKISILWPFTFYSDPALAYCVALDRIQGVPPLKRLCASFGYKMSPNVIFAHQILKKFNDLDTFHLIFENIGIHCMKLFLIFHENLTSHSPPLFSLTPPSSWCRTIPAKVRQQAKEPIVMLQKSSCAHSFLDEVSVLFSVKNKKQQTKAYGLIRLVFIIIVYIVDTIY